MPAASFLWRRLDRPGHDACRLEQRDEGWRLEGTAVFAENGSPARLTYEIACDPQWRTERGRVQGWLGPEPVAFDIAHTGRGAWTLNGNVVPGLDGCADLDLGFTPATNLLQLRRLALAPGQAADVAVAWLDVAGGTLEVLFQRYERRSTATYFYAAPRFDYSAVLIVDATGFIHRYPGLWEVDPGLGRRAPGDPSAARAPVTAF
jgi:hypothetical protein